LLKVVPGQAARKRKAMIGLCIGAIKKAKPSARYSKFEMGLVGQQGASLTDIWFGHQMRAELANTMSSTEVRETREENGM
jgi:hypothetical protein